MTETIRTAAAAALAEVEKVTAVVLPEPGTEIVTLEAAPPPRWPKTSASGWPRLDMTNTQSIISFGSGAQAELQVISQDMLDDVKNKDVGPAGDSLRNIVSAPSAAFRCPNSTCAAQRSWWEKLLGRAAPFSKFISRFENVQGQIDKITDDLD